MKITILGGHIRDTTGIIHHPCTCRPVDMVPTPSPSGFCEKNTKDAWGGWMDGCVNGCTDTQMVWSFVAKRLSNLHRIARGRTTELYTSIELSGTVLWDNLACCYTALAVAHPTCRPSQSQFTDTWSSSSSTDPDTSGMWKGSH